MGFPDICTLLNNKGTTAVEDSPFGLFSHYRNSKQFIQSVDEIIFVCIIHEARTKKIVRCFSAGCSIDVVVL